MTTTDTTERVDHVAEALELIEGSRAEKDIEAAALILAEAQVHATLALVEQQRIANLGAADPSHPCWNHRPVQHRDGKPPWCNSCGLTAAGHRPSSRFDREETGR